MLAKVRSFSALSAPIFPRKYAFYCICWDLHDYLPELPKFGKIIFPNLQIRFCDLTKISDFSYRFFAKCCQTYIFLQNFALIQPRTSPPKICKKKCKTLQIFCHDPNEQPRWRGSPSRSRPSSRAGPSSARSRPSRRACASSPSRRGPALLRAGPRSRRLTPPMFFLTPN